MSQFLSQEMTVSCYLIIAGLYLGSSLQLITLFALAQYTLPINISSFSVAGDWPLSVINYSQFNHHFCAMSVVEVLDRLQNLTTSCLVNKIIQSLLSCGHKFVSGSVS